MAGTKAPWIAVVDDEESIRTTIGYALQREGFKVKGYADGWEAWEDFQVKLPTLAILDILMPRIDGLELCRRIRSRSLQVPLIFLTSKDEEFDRVLGLELGADDYLCKPFSMKELIARVRVLLRRLTLGNGNPAEEAVERIEAGGLSLDARDYTCTWKDGALPLTVTEFRILFALAKCPGQVFSREQLLKHGYPEDVYVTDRSIDSHIKRIRRKLNALEPGYDGIEAVYGLGYRLKES